MSPHGLLFGLRRPAGTGSGRGRRETGGWPASSPPCGTGAATHQGPELPYPAVRQRLPQLREQRCLPGPRERQAVPQGPELQRLRPEPWQGPGPAGCPPEVRGWRQTLLPPEQRGQSRLAPSGEQSRARYRKSRQEWSWSATASGRSSPAAVVCGAAEETGASCSGAVTVTVRSCLSWMVLMLLLRWQEWRQPRSPWRNRRLRPGPWQGLGPEGCP